VRQRSTGKLWGTKINKIMNDKTGYNLKSVRKKPTSTFSTFPYKTSNKNGKWAHIPLRLRERRAYDMHLDGSFWITAVASLKGFLKRIWAGAVFTLAPQRQSPRARRVRAPSPWLRVGRGHLEETGGTGPSAGMGLARCTTVDREQHQSSALETTQSL